MTASTAGEFLVPFKGRNPSGFFEQNFLWKSGNVYVMDNHRAALWCWLQHIPAETHHSLFHIDRHYDTVKCDRWLPQLPLDWNMSIDQYLNFPFEDDDEHDDPLFRFDNYLSIYFAKFGHPLKNVQFATHGDGDFPNRHIDNQIAPWELPFSVLDSQKSPWIMNIDLDYFFCDDANDGHQRFISDDYVESIFDRVRQKIDDGSIAVTTIALSPEYCGGWKPSERVMEIATAKLGINFKLSVAQR
jgi:hypothetical protein